ncbi:MAG: PadR family transcriptional regulator [Bacteroidota bacterium]
MNKSTLYKGCLEPIVMRLLKDNDRMYGYQITRMVKEITKGELQITEGALYPLLHKLEEQGIVETEIENVGNRARKYYTLTKAGKKQTNAAMDELKTFIQSLNLIVNPKIAG